MPAKNTGMHNTAVEAKESVLPKLQGMILGSITLQNLAAFYPQICGMTGTAETEAKKIEDKPVTPADSTSAELTKKT